MQIIEDNGVTEIETTALAVYIYKNGNEYYIEFDVLIGAHAMQINKQSTDELIELVEYIKGLSK
jgi:hypothetical protein